LYLIQQAQAGQAEAFAALVARYQPALFRVARSRLGRSDWAEDVVQETFLCAFKSRHTYRPEFSFRTWLWTILINQCHAHAARRNRQPRVSAWSDEAPLERALEGADHAPWQRLVSDERLELLESLLARLSPVQADALRLRFFGGLKFQEIADTMGCSLGTAKNRVQWGLAQLSKWLAADSNAAGAQWRDSLSD
jgi:RNA polymerase sigma-70 factor (ECF subfamily)